MGSTPSEHVPTDVLPIIQDNDTPLDDMAPLVIQPITWRYTPSGVPLVIGDVPDVVARVREEFHWGVWYLVAHKRVIEEYKGGWYGGQQIAAQDIPHDTPKIFKVIDNMVGWSIHEAPEENIGLSAITQEAMFMLPPIPWLLIQKLDNFFRSVHQELRTEAIVILTYNPGVGGSEGWGVVVPAQENTAGHCKYDQDSIVAAKDDDAFVVGSVHSHPGMSAYASGVDHSDQADFDGLHITFGWSNHTNQGATEFYAEMQMGGKAWRVDPDTIFLDMPEPVKFEEVNDWRARVKAQPPQTPSTSSPSSSMASSKSTAQGFKPDAGYGTDFGYLTLQDQKAKTVQPPKVFPDLTKFVVIAELRTPDESHCPTCGVVLDDKSREFLLCHECWNFIAEPGMTVAELVARRKALGVDTVALSPRNTKKEVRFVTRRTDNQVNITNVTLIDPEPLDAMDGGDTPLAPAAPTTS